MDNNYLSPVVLKHNDNQESLGFLSGIGNTQEIHTHFLGNLDQVSDIEKNAFVVTQKILDNGWNKIASTIEKSFEHINGSIQDDVNKYSNLHIHDTSLNLDKTHDLQFLSPDKAQFVEPTPTINQEAIMPLNAMVRSVGGSGYDVYQPAYSNPAWGVVGGAMGIAGLFFGGSNTPGSIAHKAREQFHDKSDYVGEQILGRPLTAQESNQYGDIVYGCVKHDTKHMGPYNGPKQGWDDAMRQITFDLAHSQETTNQLNTIYENTLNQPINNTALQNDINALSGEQTSLADIRNEVAHSQVAQNYILSVVSGVQDRQATVNTDSGFLTSTMNDLGNGTNTITNVRNGLIGSQGEVGVINTYEHGLYNVDADQNTINWVRGQLYSGKSIQDVRNIDAHSGREQETLLQTLRDIQYRAASESTDAGFLTTNMNALGSGQTTLSDIRNGLISLPNEDWAINYSEQTLFGHDADQATKDWARAEMRNGKSMQDLHQIEAHSDREKETLLQTLRDIQYRAASESTDANFLTTNMNALGNGQTTLSDIRNGLISLPNEDWAINYSEQTLFGHDADQATKDWARAEMRNGKSMQDLHQIEAHNQESTTELQSAYAFVNGQVIDNATLAGFQNAMGNGESRDDVFKQIVNSASAQSVIDDVYADWGQLPPDSSTLQTARTALYNLSYAWTTSVQNQTAAQLATEAAAYTPSVSVSFQDLVNNLASSPNQAVGLEANLLTNPYLESGATIDETRTLMTVGGVNSFAASIDEESVIVEIKDLQQDNSKVCDPVQFRSAKSIVTNISNANDIKPANQTFDTVNGKNWSQSYKDNGIQWKSAGGRNDDQGLPYEAWVQNQLNPTHDPNGVVWLQNEKSNWRTFDHWDRDNGDAISDKTIDLQLPWYQKNPTAVAARVMASAYKMAGYNYDQSKIGSNSFVSFRQNQIQMYTLKIGVPYITDPAEMTPELQNEWKALCRAYHRANDIIPKQTGKPISIQIDTVS
ncbi:endonuclease toxin domain-containing protein [Acetobacter pasteurianus]|uniref:CdiA toxin EC869-like domain-containing protein n=1 Tax=Acetobacter pasteurianus NBRC 3188 TaxID=1226663 RepID=A0A401WXS7_ACEPA|nr:hypothetical protein [Acetobacter pasteurianus]GCD54010.1 hypothetical protein NBRC3188_2707 [Acetobacter pasteurianus NBRC 3188]